MKRKNPEDLIRVARELIQAMPEALGSSWVGQIKAAIAKAEGR